MKETRFGVPCRRHPCRHPTKAFALADPRILPRKRKVDPSLSLLERAQLNYQISPLLDEATIVACPVTLFSVLGAPRPAPHTHFLPRICAHNVPQTTSHRARQPGGRAAPCHANPPRKCEHQTGDLSRRVDIFRACVGRVRARDGGARGRYRRGHGADVPRLQRGLHVQGRPEPVLCHEGLPEPDPLPGVQGTQYTQEEDRCWWYGGVARPYVEPVLKMHMVSVETEKLLNCFQV